MTKAKAWEVTDEFWKRVEPLIPVRQRVAEQTYTRKTGGGRKPKDPRLVFEGIVFVLRTGCQWRRFPQSATAVQVQYMRAFWSGRKLESLRPCGNKALPSTMSLKASLGDGKALMGR